MGRSKVQGRVRSVVLERLFEREEIMRLCCTENEKCKILLIEDDDLFYETFREFLDQRGAGGFELFRARTFDTGLSLLKMMRPDEIVLDLFLPDICRDKPTEGLERLVMQESRIPIIVASGIMDDSLGFRCVDLGAHDFIIKHELTASSLVRALRAGVAHQRYRNRLLDICTELETEAQELKTELSHIKGEQDIADLSVSTREPLLSILRVAENIESKVRVMRAS